MRFSGKAPSEIKEGGNMEIGIKPGYVTVQFFNPDWWMDLTPSEARQMAGLLLRKADESESEFA